jgi:ATP synthase protein I
MAAGRTGFLGSIGFWAFIAGLIIAVVGGILSPANTVIVVVLIMLGLIVGFLNITGKEILLFPVAAIALIVIGRVFEPLTVLGIGKILDNILSHVAIFMAPAAVVAAIKALWSVGKPGEKRRLIGKNQLIANAAGRE